MAFDPLYNELLKTFLGRLTASVEHYGLVVERSVKILDRSVLRA